MSLLARLAELRARRASSALLEIQEGIDAGVVDPASCDEPQFERLCILRELAIMQVEHLSPRVRRDRTLRASLEAVCRAYHAWAEQEPGTEEEPRCAAELAKSMLSLRTTLETSTPANVPTLAETPPPVVLTSLRR